MRSKQRYSPKDFFDVAFRSKFASMARYVYRIPYEDQRPVRTPWMANADRIFAQALHGHYSITLIECPFEFNFESLLSHFEWFCNFMYFNFSDTTLQFKVLKRLQEQPFKREEIVLLMNVLNDIPEPYAFSLNTYQEEAKFALLRRQVVDEKGITKPFKERDKVFREAFMTVLHERLNDFTLLQKNDSTERATELSENLISDNLLTTTKNYEPTTYQYLKLSDVLDAAQQETAITFIYDVLKELFMKPCTLSEFRALFFEAHSRSITLNISLPNEHKFDTQKLHWLLRSIRDSSLLVGGGWDVIRKKILVYNKEGRLMESAYSISEQKISSSKKRQVEIILKPLLDQLPQLVEENK